MYGYQPMYNNPYQARLDALQSPQSRPVQIVRVNGRNGADAFQMPPNSQALLLDETAPIVWLCTSDGAGYRTSTPYKIEPYQAQPEPDYNSLNERITRLEAVINGKSDASAAKPTITGGQQPDANAQAI